MASPRSRLRRDEVRARHAEGVVPSLPPVFSFDILVGSRGPALGGMKFELATPKAWSRRSRQFFLLISWQVVAFRLFVLRSSGNGCILRLFRFHLFRRKEN